MSTPYTHFTRAAEQLIQEYRMRQSGKISPEKPVIPLMIILMATIEDFAAVSSPTNPKTSPALVLSHFDDETGPVTAFDDQIFLIKAPAALQQLRVSAGDRVMIHVTMTIKTYAMADCSDWPIQYQHHDGTYCLAFREILMVKKI